MNTTPLKILATSVALAAVGIAAGNLLFGAAEAAQASDSFDTSTATVDMGLRSLPDGGAAMSGCAEMRGAYGVVRSCINATEIQRPQARAAANAMMDLVARAAFANLNFPGIDGGQ